MYKHPSFARINFGALTMIQGFLSALDQNAQSNEAITIRMLSNQFKVTFLESPREEQLKFLADQHAELLKVEAFLHGQLEALEELKKALTPPFQTP